MMRFFNLLIGLVLMAGLCTNSRATQVQTTFTALGGEHWALALNVVNNGSVPSINELTIYFPSEQFDTLTLRASPAGWDPLLIQPDLNLSAPGMFDVLALTPGDALSPHQSRSGFAIGFDYFGPGLPPALRYDVVNSNFQTIETGLTMASAVSAVPEPSPLLLLIAAVPLLLFRRRNRAAMLLMAAAVTGCGNSGNSSDTGPPAERYAALMAASPAAAGAPGVLDIAPPGASLAGFTQVSEERISRTVFRYTYRISLVNQGQALTNARVHLVGAGAGTVITDAMAEAGTVAAGSTAQLQDTLSFTQDRTLSFNPAALHWVISADAQGALGALDRSASLAGDDADHNGVRDDVDRVITELVPQKLRAAATQLGKALQQSLTASVIPTQAERTQLDINRSQACMASQTDDYERVGNTVVAITYNTEVRMRALARHMAALQNRLLPDTPATRLCD